MNNSVWEETLLACDELAAHMAKHSEGVNADALRQVLSLCARMRGPSNYINDRLNKIEEGAKRYFSPRRWAKHSRGAEGERYDIVQAGLSRIRDEARNRIAQESKHDGRAEPGHG